LDRMQRAIAESEREQQTSSTALLQLGTQLTRLNENLSRESRQLQGLAEAQLESQALLASLAQKEAPVTRLTEELRQELRLLSRTIAGALGAQEPR
ncbi:MAG: hypothetical protein PHE55_19875, partial [Methylococcaceae bacterium]|nr:hypothetical protein [Methylococcaceae bacterium]